jgi:hypothetical protein
MQEDYKRKEEKELINRFEAFLKNSESHYFDEEAFLQIISYYSSQEKYKRALSACNIAIEQFPFSPDLSMECILMLWKY